MPKQQRAWVYSPPKPAKPPVSESVKAEVTKLADALVDAVLKPKYIQPPPAPHEFQHNYLTDIFTKWYRGYFYFCSIYACPGPMRYRPPSRQNLHEWNTWANPVVSICLSCATQVSGLKCALSTGVFLAVLKGEIWVTAQPATASQIALDLACPTRYGYVSCYRRC